MAQQPEPFKSFSAGRRPQGRTVRRIAVYAPIALILTYIAFWFIVAGSAERGVENWIETQRARGLEVSHGGIATGGFPFRIEVRVASPQIVWPGEKAVTWAGPDLVIWSPPWSLQRVNWRAPGAHRFTKAGEAKPLTFTAGGLEGWAEASGAGVEKWEAWLTSGSLRRDDDPALTVRGMLVQFLPLDPSAAAADDDDKRRLPLTIDAKGITLPGADAAASPLGSEISRLTIDLALVGPLSPGQGPSNKWPEPALRWRDAGGVLEIKSLGISYGPLNLAGEGTVAIDRAAQPMGAFAARVTGHAETIDAFVKAGVIDPRSAASIHVALGLLAKGPAGGPKHLEVPLTVQDRTLSLGPIRLFKLRAVDWFLPRP